MVSVMSSVNFDVERAIDIICDRNMNHRYNRIYFRTNEDLEQLFSHIDCVDKKILSVLASGDQAFHLYNRGASQVDFFDINKLTIYYFYLRMWGIEYDDRLYPDWTSVMYIKNLFNKVKIKSSEEREAYDFWYGLLTKLSLLAFSDLFIFGPVVEHISDLSAVKDMIKHNNFTFYNVDISKDIDIEPKYDVIVKSNISDYLSADEETFKQYRDNLYSLLNPGGVVLTTAHVMNPDISQLEYDVFSKCFEIEKLLNTKFVGRRDDSTLGYVYRKR